MLGLQGSGKTTLVKHILDDVDRHIVYDPLGEYDGYRRYIPTDLHSTAELDRFVERIVTPMQPDLFVLDEANKYIDKNKETPKAVADLVDFSRHWGISWGCVARRPTQLHTDVRELAHYVFVFGLYGSNDRRLLNDWYSGMGDVVQGLDKDKHQFAVLEGGSRLTVHEAI